MKPSGEKKRIRTESLALRRALTPGEYGALSEAVAARIWTLPEFASARHVMTYVSSKDNEVDTKPMIRRMLDEGRLVWAPAMRPGRRMAWLPLRSLDELAESSFQILEPQPRGSDPAPPDTAAVLTPGLAFSRNCGRIGYGAGYFDRFLANHVGTTIGLAFECQIRDDVPSEPHDVPLDIVVTESAVYRRD